MKTRKMNHAILEPSQYSRIGDIVLPHFYQSLNPSEHLPRVAEWVFSLGVEMDDIYKTLQMLWERRDFAVFLIGRYNGERTSIELSIFEHVIRVSVKIADAELKPNNKY